MASLKPTRHIAGRTVLPHRCARLVSVACGGSMLTVRLLAYVIEAGTSSSRISSLSTIALVRTVLEGTLGRAANDTPGSSQWAEKAMTSVDDTLTLAHFTISALFHLVHAATSTARSVLCDGIYIVDGIFGSTHTSAAIVATTKHIQRELGDEVGLYSLLFAGTVFSLLKTYARHNDLDCVELELMWDVVTIDTGKTGNCNMPRFGPSCRAADGLSVARTERMHGPLASLNKVTLLCALTEKLCNIEPTPESASSSPPELTYCPSPVSNASSPLSSIAPPLPGLPASPVSVSSFPTQHITHSMAKYVKYASASYGQSFMKIFGISISTPPAYPKSEDRLRENHAFAQHTSLHMEDILLSSYTDDLVNSKSGIPLMYFVTVDHEAQAIVMTIRGTLGLEDLLTDLKCEYAEFQWQGQTWTAHSGMLKCAQTLMRPTSPMLSTVKLALDKWGPDYGVVLCGHSLGAGVAAILGILLSDQLDCGEFITSSKSLLPPGRPIRCFCYGPPASISADLQTRTEDLIVSVVYGEDIIPCLSLGLLRDFRGLAVGFRNDRKTMLEDIFRALMRHMLALPGEALADDDDLYGMLLVLRELMSNEKLMPPGAIYHLTSDVLLRAHSVHTHQAVRVVVNRVKDTQKWFREPRFGREIFHHSPLYYERALGLLKEGTAQML